MIDLHCHMLPGIDDGAADLEASLAMARIAAGDGIQVTACTPHVMAGVYDNTGPDIRRRVAEFQRVLDREGIPLKVVPGCDAHMDPDLSTGLQTGRAPSLNGSRYFLFEPPHHVAPPRLEHAVFDLMTAGYQPLLTHPERLTWIEGHYETMRRLSRAGVWMQITAGSVTGRFGRRPRYWAERMADEGLVHVLATDAHDPKRRPPLLAEARDALAERLGEDEATHMVVTRPRGVIENVEVASLPPALAERPEARAAARSAAEPKTSFMAGFLANIGGGARRQRGSYR